MTEPAKLDGGELVPRWNGVGLIVQLAFADFQAASGRTVVSLICDMVLVRDEKTPGRFEVLASGPCVPEVQFVTQDLGAAWACFEALSDSLRFGLSPEEVNLLDQARERWSEAEQLSVKAVEAWRVRVLRRVKGFEHASVSLKPKGGAQ